MASTTAVSQPSGSRVSLTSVVPPPHYYRYRLQMDMSREYFFLTIPGVIRLIEILLAGLNLGSLGYLTTFYDKRVEDVISPIFLANTREAFFVIANCSTFLTAFSIIIASMISVRSHSALLGSLFMFMFDFIHFLLIVTASVSLILLYMDSEALAVYGTTLRTRQGLVVTGMLLACLHLIGCIYDLGIYVRRAESYVNMAESSLMPPPTSGPSTSRKPDSQEEILSPTSTFP